MTFLKRFGFVLFGLFAITDIIFLVLEHNNYRYYTKSFLLPVLLFTILANSADQGHPVSKRILFIALLAGTAGDIFLLGTQNRPQFFIYGLGAFLLMQLMYCIYFFRMQSIKKEFIIFQGFVALLMVGYSLTLVGSLYKYLGELKIPVIIYATVISLMFFGAVNIFYSKRAQKLAINFFIPGAAMLVLSDSILAVNKFYLNDDLFNISVMVTYILGQLFLAIGFTKHLKSSRSSGKRRSHKSRFEGMEVEQPAE